MSVFKTSQTTTVTDIYNIRQPARHTKVHLHSPAWEIFTDFNTQIPLMLEQSTSVDKAREFMKKAHVRLKLVSDFSRALHVPITICERATSFADIYKAFHT